MPDTAVLSTSAVRTSKRSLAPWYLSAPALAVYVSLLLVPLVLTPTNFSLVWAWCLVEKLGLFLPRLA